MARQTTSRAMLVAAVSLLAILSAARTRATDLEIYGRLPSVEDVALSPDGTRVAFVETLGNKRIVRAVSLEDHKVLGQAEAGEEKVRQVLWADDDHLLVETTVTGLPPGYIGERGELVELRVLDVLKKKFMLVPDGKRIPSISFLPEVRGFQLRHLGGHSVLFTAVRLTDFQRTGVLGDIAILKVDLETGAVSRVWSTTTTRQFEYFIDSDGAVAAEKTYDEGQQRWSLKARVAGGQMREVIGGTSAIEIPHFAGNGPEADTALIQQLEEDHPTWRLLSLKDGTLGEPMKERAEMSAPIDDLYRERMIGGIRERDYEDYVFLDPGMQLRWDQVKHAFPGQHVGLVSYDSSFLRLIVMVGAPPRGLIYQLLDMRAHTAATLGELYKGAGPPLEVQRISYAAADGLRIPAYLTLPRERAMKDLPLIVLPHGGPAAHDSADFDWWSQALADQGYAVLRPNFRGSNLTRRFEEAGFGQWGRKMQTDLSDGVRDLVKQGIVDPKRVCIVGASYGGYAALAGAALDPGVYRCAVSYAGIADVSRFLSFIEGRGTIDQITLRYDTRFMGVTGARDPAVDSISPIKHLDAINVPVLLIHGRDDTVVPFEQSQVMYEALHGANKDVDLIELKAEDHWLSRSETRLQMLQDSVAFLRRYNPPD